MSIKSFTDCAYIQHKRYWGGKKGIAKAVRRYLRRTRAEHDNRPWNGYKLLANFTGCKMMNPDTYKPANWS